MKERKYQCKFCKTRFVYEDRFIAHRCKQMIRDEEFRTPEGQAAWIHYQSWMKAYRRMVPNSSGFLQSKYYNSFMKFARFCKDANVPDTETYIWLMKERDISPTIWTNDQVYGLYLEFMDRKLPPMKHAQITVDTILDLADDFQCTSSEVFDHITPNELIQLLRQRQLSPWILLHSGKFKHFFINKLSVEERIIMESIIRPPYWATKFQTCQSDVNQMKKFVSELKL